MANITKRNNSYRFRVSNGYSVDGKQRFATKTWVVPEGMSDCRAEKEAARQAVLFEEEVKGGASTSAIKFQTFMDEWFRDYAELSLKEETLKSYRSNRRRLGEEFGHLRLDRITTRDIQRFVGKLSSAPRNDGKAGILAPKTIKHHVTMLSSIFSYAVKMQIVLRNPCVNITYPRRHEKPREMLTLPEVQLLLTLLRKENDLMFPTYLTLAMYTGLRRGELAGLEWKDINLDVGLLSVRRAAYYSTAKGYYTDTPKSKTSLRTLKLSADVLPLLRRYKAQQAATAATLCNKWHDTDRLFTAWDGGNMYSNAAEEFYKKFCKQHGLRVVTLHSFRHLNASLLINAGLDVKVVQSALGHSSAMTTLNTYAHEFQTAAARASEAVSTAIGLSFSR
ncbi:site-specific integrase [Clostridia bacterium]|nr:site-specific integrase [Clostridia bacterium]